MSKEMISVGLGILVAIVPLLSPDLSRFFVYSLFGVAAILVILGGCGLVRSRQRKYAKTGDITIFHVTLRK